MIPSTSPRSRSAGRRSAGALFVLFALIAVSCVAPPPSGPEEYPQAPLSPSLSPGVGGSDENLRVDTAPQTELMFAPPALSSPEVVEVSASNRNLKLDDARDYVIKMPTKPLVAEGGLVITGGRNVVLIGGEIHHDRWWTRELGHANRALYLKHQTGTIHVEGLRFSGHLTEGISLDQRKGAIVQIQNLHTERLIGSQRTNHADVIQTWGGPRVLRVHRLTGESTYQGIFMRPNDRNVGYRGQTQEVTLDSIQIIQTPESAYAYWKGNDYGIDYPVTATNLWITNPRSTTRDQVLWPKGSPVWSGVRMGTPPGGDLVPASSVGIGYVSPGYR